MTTTRSSKRVAGHAAKYEVARDPEGNFWTVTCECGHLQESGSTRDVARHEHRAHLDRLARLDRINAEREAEGKPPFGQWR